MNTMSVKFFDGKQVTTWHNIINIQFLERTTDGDTYVITNVNNKRYTVYGNLICSEVKEDA